MEQLGSHWKDFHEILYGSVFRKSVVKIEVSLNLTRIAGMYMKTDTHFLLYLSQFVLERELFQTKAVQKIKTHISCSTFPKIVSFIR